MISKVVFFLKVLFWIFLIVGVAMPFISVIALFSESAAYILSSIREAVYRPLWEGLIDLWPSNSNEVVGALESGEEVGSAAARLGDNLLTRKGWIIFVAAVIGLFVIRGAWQRYGGFGGVTSAATSSFARNFIPFSIGIVALSILFLGWGNWAEILGSSAPLFMILGMIVLLFLAWNHIKNVAIGGAVLFGIFLAVPFFMGFFATENTVIAAREFPVPYVGDIYYWSWLIVGNSIAATYLSAIVALVLALVALVFWYQQQNRNGN